MYIPLKKKGGGSSSSTVDPLEGIDTTSTAYQQGLSYGKTAYRMIYSDNPPSELFWSNYYKNDGTGQIKETLPNTTDTYVYGYVNTMVWLYTYHADCTYYIAGVKYGWLSSGGEVSIEAHEMHPEIDFLLPGYSYTE